MIEIKRVVTQFPYMCDMCEVVAMGKIISTVRVLSKDLIVLKDITLHLGHVLPESFECSDICKSCHEEMEYP